MNAALPPLRPPAVPLVVCDPYLSVWSITDALTEDRTRHWTGKPQSMFGLLSVDGQAYGFAGPIPRRGDEAIPVMRQDSVEVLPTRTIYQFSAAGVKLKLTFLTPALPHDLEVMSRPVTYVDFQVAAADGAAHEVALYFDISADWVVNIPHQHVVWGRHRFGEVEALWMGSAEQDVLGKAGDDVRIDWGYLYGAAPQASASGFNRGYSARRRFAESGKLPASDAVNMPSPAGEWSSAINAAWVFEFGAVTAEPAARQLVIAYDDQFSVEYMYRRLRPYWRRDGLDAGSLVQTALHEFAELKQRCEAFDAEIMDDLRRAGGEAYARLAALSFRQCVAAHKLVVDFDGTPLYFSKENFSNGCMGTVDVAYPSSPFFLLFNPALLEAQLRPILDYAGSSRWRFPFAPHDVGVYPLANGQVYGGGEESERDQMPVEECGNMLLMVAAYCQARGEVIFARRYWGILTRWANYLVDKGLDPENQLCTDDFAGHLAHNVNLSLKAILAVAAYAQMCDMAGLTAEAKDYRARAEAMAQDWLRMADDGDHYRLTFDRPDTWSQKYNLVWDKLLGLDLFPAAVAEKEVAFYKTQIGRYGLPLDQRSLYTKLDWIIWSASLAHDARDFEVFVAPLHQWMNETESRVPLTDWYYTDSGKQAGFQARSVVGGVFIKLLGKPKIWQKWASRAGEKR